MPESVIFPLGSQISQNNLNGDASFLSPRLINTEKRLKQDTDIRMNEESQIQGSFAKISRNSVSSSLVELKSN